MLAAPVWASSQSLEQPVWWPDAAAQAEKDGYSLVTCEEFESLGAPGEEYVLIDVRADYEFAAGHIPGAVNLEFNLADRQAITKEKQQALLDIADGDKARRLIFYCRSFR